MEETLIALAEIGSPSVSYNEDLQWWARLVVTGEAGSVSAELRATDYATPSEAVGALEGMRVLRARKDSIWGPKKPC